MAKNKKTKKNKKLDESVDKLKPTFDNEFYKLYKWNNENNPQEINLMFGMIALLKEKKGDWVELDYGMVKLLAGRNVDENPGATFEFLQPALKNISSAVPIDTINEDGQEITTISSLFVSQINHDERTMRIRVIKDEVGQMIFNHLEFSRGFTKLNYTHLHNINSAAGKKLYILLSKYKNQGVMNFPIEDIRSAIDSDRTMSYSNRRFMSKVLTPAIEDIELYLDPDFTFTYKSVFNAKKEVSNLIFFFTKNERRKKVFIDKDDNIKIEDEEYMKIRDEKIKSKEECEIQSKKKKIDELSIKERERNNNTNNYINYTEEEKNEIFKSSY